MWIEIKDKERIRCINLNTVSCFNVNSDLKNEIIVRHFYDMVILSFSSEREALDKYNELVRILIRKDTPNV